MAGDYGSVVVSAFNTSLKKGMNCKQVINFAYITDLISVPQSISTQVSLVVYFFLFPVCFFYFSVGYGVAVWKIKAPIFWRKGMMSQSLYITFSSQFCSRMMRLEFGIR